MAAPLVVVLAACSSQFQESAPASTGTGAASSRSAAAGDGPGGDRLAMPVKPGGPCPDAHRRSLEELASIAETPVWMPRAARASEATLTGVWSCGPDLPVLTFGPVAVSYEAGYGKTRLPWARKAEDTGGFVTTILGRPGLVDPAGAGQPTGEVMVVVDDGVLVRVIGDRSVPAGELVDVPRSIDLGAPVTP